MHSARTGRILAVVVAVALAGALGAMWLRSGGDDVEVATAAQAEAGDGAEGNASGAEGDADSDDSGDSDEPTPASADDDDPADSSTDDAAEGPDTDADDPSIDATDDSADGVDDEPVDEPTEEPTDEATDAPDEEPSDDPTEDPSEDPNGVDEELRAELDELRTVGGPAEALVPAEDQEEIDNWLHAGWGIDLFQPEIEETSEWSNRDDLWDEITDAVWERAVKEYGDRLRDRPGTIWDPAGPTVRELPYPAYGATMVNPAGLEDYGYLMWMWVGVDPEDEGQNRPDAGVFYVQVIPEEEAPGLWYGDLHRVIHMCVISGELEWDDSWGGSVRDAIGACGSDDLADSPWETVEEITGGAS